MRNNRHYQYLKYVLRHKYFVFMAHKKTGASIWRCLLYDLSKFTLSEWIPYANTFYSDCGSKQYNVLINDSGKIEALPMPEKYVREMVADWIGAGLAITGTDNTLDWYINHKDKMLLHRDTENLINTVFREIGYL